MIGKSGVVLRRYLAPNSISGAITTTVSGTSVTASWSAVSQTLLAGDTSQVGYTVILYNISSGSFVEVLTENTSNNSVTLNEPGSPSGNLYVVGVTPYNTFAVGNSQSTSDQFSFVR